MNILVQLQQKERFSTTENHIIDYILANPERILSMSIYDLATATNSATASIVRLSKKFHVSGFKEFKIKLSRDLETYYTQSSEIDPNLPFASHDNYLQISKKIAQLTVDSIETTRSLLTYKRLEEAVALLVRAQTILGFGVSNSFIRLLDFQTKLLKIHKPMQLIHMQPELFHLANSAKEGDVALIVSYSGTTSEIVNDAQILHAKKIPIITITSNLDSTLANYSTIVLPLPAKETSELKISTFSSQLAIEYLLNVLYSCMYKNDFEKNYQLQKNTPISILKF